MSRPVSRVILPALEAPRSNSFAARMKSRPQHRPEPESDIPSDPLARALLLAIQDMQILVGHVHALLNGPVAEEARIIEWLKRIQAELELSHKSVVTGKMSSREVITMEDEEPAGLEDALSHAWESEDNEWPDQPEFELLARLTEYWLLQVRDRGYALIHLMIGADDLIGATHSLQKLNEVRYPL